MTGISGGNFGSVPVQNIETYVSGITLHFSTVEKTSLSDGDGYNSVGRYDEYIPFSRGSLISKMIVELAGIVKDAKHI